MIFGRPRTPRPSSVRHKKAPEGEFTKRESKVEGIFGNKPHITRRRFRKKLREAPRHISEASAFSKEERVGMEEKLFPTKEYGAYITPYEVNKRMRRLKKELYRSREPQEKVKMRKQLKFLEKLKGPEN